MTKVHTRPPVKGEEGYGFYTYLCEQEQESNRYIMTLFCLDLTGDYFEADSLKELIKDASEYYVENKAQPDYTIVDLHTWKGGIGANDKGIKLFMDKLDAAIESLIKENYAPDYDRLTGHEMGVCKGAV